MKGFLSSWGLAEGSISEKLRGLEDRIVRLAVSGAELMRLWWLPLSLAAALCLLNMSAAGCSTWRTDSWCASVCAELSMVLCRSDNEGDMMRCDDEMSDATLLLLFRSAMLVLLCTKRWTGALSACDTMELRSEYVREPTSVEELMSLLYAMFLPECRRVCFLWGGVTMTWADTTVEATDAVESRLLLASRCFSDDMRLFSEGQPMDCAKFSTDGVVGLLWPTWTRLRRLEARRALVGEGDAVSTTVTAGSGVLQGDFDCGLRFFRTVTLRISSVFHSRSGMSSMVGDTWSGVVSTVPTSLAVSTCLVGVTGKEGACRVVGVTSFLSCSKARPSPWSSWTVLSLSVGGVAQVLSSRSEEMGSSLAVWNEVAREEGYV